ncbi:MAG TPA: hypothetical protein VM779_14450 [Thermoanaerobaculia bacterium]|nr:hypothetical protein [Thermoanaerobaculia bacterium]
MPSFSMRGSSERGGGGMELVRQPPASTSPTWKTTISRSDGKVVLSGRVPKPDDVRQLLGIA